ARRVAHALTAATSARFRKAPPAPRRGLCFPGWFECCCGMECAMADVRTNAVRVREALPADGPGLVDVIMAINEETEFLGTSEDRPHCAERPEQCFRDLRARLT